MNVCCHMIGRRFNHSDKYESTQRQHVFAHRLFCFPLLSLRTNCRVFFWFCFFVTPACVSSSPRSHRGEDQIFQFARRAPSEKPSNDTHQKPFCTCFRPANVNACKSNQPPASNLLSRPCAFIPTSKAPDCIDATGEQFSEKPSADS